MSSEKYWKEREVKLRDKLLNTAIEDTEKELIEQYKKAAKSLIIEIQKYYAEIITEPDVINSHRYSYNKYYDLVTSLQKELLKLGNKEIKTLDKRFKKLYFDNQKLLDKQFPLGSSINQEAAIKVINEAWVGDGLNWSSRVWLNKTILQKTLEEGLFQIVTTGKKPDDVTKMVMEKCKQSYANASRLVRTELCHIQTQSTLDKYKNAGLQQYRYLTARDERTCEVCGTLDNQIFNIVDGKYGKNLPPMHPNCRCTILGVININQEIKK